MSERIPRVIPVFASEEFMVAAAYKGSINITSYPPDVLAVIDIAREGAKLQRPIGALALFAPSEDPTGDNKLDLSTPMYQYIGDNPTPCAVWARINEFYNADDKTTAVFSTPANEQAIALRLFAAAKILPEATGQPMNPGEIPEIVRALRPVNLHIQG